MLNPTQHSILCSFFDDLFDEDLFCCGEVTVLHPKIIISALEQLLDHQEQFTNETLEAIAHQDFRSIVISILDILRHECPQNRVASAVQVPQNEQAADLGFIYFRDDASKDLLREKRGLLGLTARNDEKYKPPVDRNDVRAFVRDRIKQELRVQRARLAVCEHADAKLEEMKHHQAQKEEFRSVLGRVETAIASCQVENALDLLRGMSQDSQAKAKQRTKEMLLQTCGALAINSLLHHLEKEEEDALSDMDLLRSIALSPSCKSPGLDLAFVSKFQAEFLASNLLKMDIEQLTIDMIRDTLEQIPQDHASRGHILLRLAQVHERASRFEDAAGALCSAVEALPKQIVASLTEDLYAKLYIVSPTSVSLFEIRKKLASAVPPSQLARFHLMQLRHRQGLLRYDHQDQLMDIIKDTRLDISIRCEAITMFFLTQKGLQFRKQYPEQDAAFDQILRSQELETVASSLLLDIVELMRYYEPNFTDRLLEHVLARNDTQHPRAVFLQSYCGTDQNTRLAYVQQALEYGWNLVDCKVRIAELTPTLEAVEDALGLLPQMNQSNTIRTLLVLYDNTIQCKGNSYERALGIMNDSFQSNGDFLVVFGPQVQQATALHIALLHLLCKQGFIEDAKEHIEKLEEFIDGLYDCDEDDALDILFESTMRACFVTAWKLLIQENHFEAGLFLFKVHQQYTSHDFGYTFTKLVWSRREDVPSALLAEFERISRKALLVEESQSSRNQLLVAIAHLCIFQNRNEEAAAALNKIILLLPDAFTVFFPGIPCLQVVLALRSGNNKKALKEYDAFIRTFISIPNTYMLTEIKLLFTEVGALLLKQARTNLGLSRASLRSISEMVVRFEQQFPEDPCPVTLTRYVAEAQYIAYKDETKKTFLHRALQNMELVVGSPEASDEDRFLFSDMLTEACEYMRSLDALRQCSDMVVDEAKVRIIKVQLAELRFLVGSNSDPASMTKKLGAALDAIEQIADKQPSQAKKLLKQVRVIEKEISAQCSDAVLPQA